MRTPSLRKLAAVLLSLCAAALFAASSAAGARAQTQITTGVIQGTITDEKEAVIPGASVEARNLDTNLTRTFSTDDDGRFAILQLPPGRYTVTVSKPEARSRVSPAVPRGP